MGDLISEDGVAVDSSQVEAVTSYPQPTDVKELRGFLLGLANYYRRFVQGFTSYPIPIAHPFYQLTSKNAKGFHWTPHCQQTFDQLKQLLVSPPILAYLRFEIPFAVQSVVATVATVPVRSQVQIWGKQWECCRSFQTTATSRDQESTTTEGDPEIIALVQDPEPGSLHMLSQTQSNDQVLQEVKIALQQDTTLPWQFQGKRDKLLQKQGVLYYHQTDSSPLQQSSLTAYKEPSWSRYTKKVDIHTGKAEGTVLLARARGSGGEMGQRMLEALGGLLLCWQSTQSLKHPVGLSLLSIHFKNFHGTLWVHSQHRQKGAAIF